MLIHIPIFVVDQKANLSYQLQLLFTCIQSYYGTRNTVELLISTNDAACHSAIERFKKQTAFPFKTELVDEVDIQVLFGYNRADKPPIGSRKMVLSKFHPMLRKLDTNILHVDYDTLFNRTIDINRFFHGHVSFWSSIVDKKAINTGVMAFDQHGMTLLSKLIQEEGILQSGKFRGRSIRTDNDEFFIMDLYFKSRMRVLKHSSRKHCHCLAYELDKTRHWQQKANILHFHWYKPVNCTVTGRGPDFHENDLFSYPLSAREKGRLNNDFYAAILMWYEQYNLASRNIPQQHRLISAPDDKLLNGERQRLLLP
jgi:hypothetical protein